MDPLASVVWKMVLDILGLCSVLFMFCVLFIFRPSKANNFLLILIIFFSIHWSDSTHYVLTTSFFGNIIV